MKIFNKNSVLAITIISISLSIVGLTIAATKVNLGTADNFAILAGSFITATTPSIVNGNVGLSPAAGTFYTGLTIGQVTGTIYAVDVTGPAGLAGNNAGLLTTANIDLSTAYGLASGQAPTVIYAPIHDLGGVILTPGVYNDPSSFGITGTLTLDGQGDPNAVFIFQAGSTLVTAANSNVVLINGAQSCNIFWQVGSSATLGTGSNFKGNILAFSSITDNGGSIVEGRFLARNAAVTLNNTNITKAVCVAPPAPPAPSTDIGGVFSMSWTAPLISVLNVPSPLDLPSGTGLSTYNYTVSNIGIVPMSNVTVTDNKCANVHFISGDINNDNILGVNEIWKYNCATVLYQTTTNTVTATGQHDFFTAIDTANATVVVGSPLTPPLIHIVKKPNVFSLPSGGGAVTYTYTVTNPGTVPLSDVSVIDDKCTGLPGRVVGHPGDINKNNLLESNESWSFTCQTNITKTTTNTGTAEGHANGLTAIDFSLATVIVDPPTAIKSTGLPNTGIDPQEKNIYFDAIAVLIMIFTASIFLNSTKRKAA